MMGGDAESWFVYGLLPLGLPAPAVAGVLPGATVVALELGAASVLASRVARAPFDRDDPAHRTADPDWIAARVAAYHDVNAAAAAAGPFLPLAFGTLFCDLDLLRAWLQPRRAAVAAALARVAEQAEWALSLQADATAQSAWLDRHDPALRDLADSVARAGEGTAFLLSRRLGRARDAARAAHLADAARSVAAALAQGGLTVLPETRPDPAWTILVPRARQGTGDRGTGDRGTGDRGTGDRGTGDRGTGDWPGLLEPLADALDPAGLSLRLTGPWPAYAFAHAALNTGPDGESAHG